MGCNSWIRIKKIQEQKMITDLFVNSGEKQTLRRMIRVLGIFKIFFSTVQRETNWATDAQLYPTWVV